VKGRVPYTWQNLLPPWRCGENSVSLGGDLSSSCRYLKQLAGDLYIARRL